MPSQRTQPDNAPTALPPKTGRGEGHDRRGRFTPGNRCGQGNPAAKQTAVLRQALRAAISPEDITEIAEVLRELALDGNLAAIRLLLSYVVGRPGAAEEDPAEPGPSLPETPTVAQEPAPLVETAPQASADRPAAPGGDPAPVPAAGAGPAAPAPEVPLPPPATVDNGGPSPRPPSAPAANGPATRPPPSPTADSGERPPTWAIRRWPR